MRFFNREAVQQTYLQQHIAAALVNLVYSQAKPAIAGSLIVASCLVYGLHQVVPANVLYGWFALMWFVTVTRYVLIKLYLNKKRTLENEILWRKIFIFMVACAGVSWSLAGTLLMPDSSVHQTFIVSSLAGVAAGAIPFFSGSRTACFVFVMPVLCPFAVWSLFQSDQPHHVLGFLTLLYVSLLLISCFRTHKAIYNAIKLKFENDELVASLTTTKIEMETINEELQHEINDRKKAEGLLRESEEQYRLVTDALPVLISYLDMDLHYRFINKAHAAWFGRSLDEIAGQPIRNILDSSGFVTFQEHVEKLQSDTTITYETVMQFHQDEERYVSVTLIPHVKDGEMQGFFSLINDMTPRINYLATHDALTDLPNRSLFNAKFTQAINRCKSQHTRLALIFFDLDHFKNINDTLGHDVGDNLLIKVVERVKQSLRDTDVLARLGGDEFTILLESVTRAGIVSVADKLHNVFSHPFKLREREIFITTSIGISVYPDDGLDMQILFKNADMATYCAKENGRNNYQFYTANMNEKMIRKTNLENDLRNALDNDELTVYYQPVMDIASNSITSLEALLRWKHPVDGFVSPTEFIPIAEGSGLIMPIGEWVINNVCQQNMTWQKEKNFPVNLRTAINLSARQFKDANLVQLVTSTLNATGLNGKYVTLELTESLIMHDIEYSVGIIKQLKDLGICISIDDFGTGYSSLNYLRRFPIDVLKIDQSFITDIRDSDKNTDDASAIVTAIIAMAHSLKMKVIAEGVETMKQYQFLKERGCDEIQGYLLSRPVPPEEIATFLKNSFSVEKYLQQQAAKIH
jgi:diguanylate cyclase (GGDEF)-like protein/PAS domain S-box-containing protein